MLETILKEEHEKADALALRKKQESDYIAGIVEQNYEQLVQAFDPHKEIDPEKLPRTLYDKTKKTIEHLQEYYQPIGIITSHGKKFTGPEFTLGWAGNRLYNEEAEDPVYLPFITEKGYEVLDNLRDIRGQLPYKESVKKARERFRGGKSA